MDGLEPWNILQPVIVTGHATKTAATVGGGLAKGFSIASIGASIGKIATNVSNKISEQNSILKWNASNRWDNFKQAASDKFDDIRAGIEQKAYNEGKPIWKETLEIALGGSLDEPGSFMMPEEGIVAKIVVKETEILGKGAVESLYKDITIKGAERALRKGKELNKLLDISPNDFVKNLGVDFKQNGNVWGGEKNGVSYFMRKCSTRLEEWCKC